MRTNSGRHRFCLWLAAGALLTGTLAFATPARAQSADEINIARQTAGEGLQAYKEGNFEKALRLFEEAKAIYPSAQILRMVGYSQLGLERWEKAADAMEAALGSQVGPLSAGDKDDVKAQLDKALAHFGNVNVTSRVQGAELKVDGGDKRPLPLDKPLRLLEGKHSFAVIAEGHHDAVDDVDVRGGKTIDLPLEPQEIAPDAPPPPKPVVQKAAPPPPSTGWFPMQRPIGFAAAGVGVVLGGAALATALGGAHLRSNVEADATAHTASYGENCDRGDYRECTFDRAVINHDADRADGLRDASMFMGIGAGVLVAAGVVLVVFSPSEPAAPQKGSAPGRRVACGPLGAGLTCAGAF